MYSDSINYSGRAEISYKDLYKRIVELIKEETLKRSLKPEDFKNTAETIIEDYVNTKIPYVIGYLKDGELMRRKLVNDLVNSVTSWGKLTVCKEDSEIREIQINGKFIYVDRKNGYSLLRDPQGNVISFDSPEESLDFIKARLLSTGIRMTEDEPLVNVSTVEGFRLAATGPWVNPPHPSRPGERWVTSVIRKLGDKQFTKDELIANGTACAFQLDWISLTYEALLGNTIAGQTGCGKTTIQDIGMRSMRNRDRAICIQSPTEYHYENIVDGVMQNNAVYWEVNPNARKDSLRSATLENLVSQTLRFTSNLDMLGELKDTADFCAATRAINAGVFTSTTLHTRVLSGILDRWALELVNGLGMELNIARELTCTYLGPLTLCDRLGDGSRKVMGTAEVVGFDRIKQEYLINVLSEFVLATTVDRDGEEGEQGMIWNVGYFVKRGNPCEATIRNILKQLPESKLKPILDIPVGQVLKEVNFDKLPEDYVVKYDYNVIPMEETLRGYEILSEEKSKGILLG